MSETHPAQTHLFSQHPTEHRSDFGDRAHGPSNAAPPAASEDRPRLTLVRPDDDDAEAAWTEDAPESDPSAAPKLDNCNKSTDEANDGWPWNMSGFNAPRRDKQADETPETTATLDESEDAEAAQTAASDTDDDGFLGLADLPVFDDIVVERNAVTDAEHVTAHERRHEPGPVDDHSATQDLILNEAPLVTAPIDAMDDSAADGGLDSDILELDAEPVAQVAEAERPGDIARTGINRPGLAPRRIGSGQLIPARLTWKPGDPFASISRPVHCFRWDVMLTTAGITAACGLATIWLLRAVLA